MKYLPWLILFASHAEAFEPTLTRQQELLNLLKHDCGACHGITLKGGLGPPLLTESLNDKPTELLIKTIREGRPGTAMPPWGKFISEQEALWLIQQFP
jgi:cytochrome c55X